MAAEVTYDIAAYFPAPGHGVIQNKMLHFESDLVNPCELWQFRNADIDGLTGTRLDYYTPNGSGWTWNEAEYYKPDPTGLLEYEDFTPGRVTYQPGKEINWGQAGVINPLLPNSSLEAVESTGGTLFHTVFLNQWLPSITTPFGIFNDILVVNFVQTYNAVSTQGVYYMQNGRGPARIDYPNSPPRYAQDQW